MKYLVLAVPSDLEADRLIADLSQNPGEPLLTPHWGDAVHATLAAVTTEQPLTAEAGVLQSA